MGARWENGAGDRVRHFIERPFQIDGRRPRRDQQLVGTVDAGVGTIVAHRQRHAVGGGRPINGAPRTSMVRIASAAA